MPESVVVVCGVLSRAPFFDWSSYIRSSIRVGERCSRRATNPVPGSAAESPARAAESRHARRNRGWCCRPAGGRQRRRRELHSRNGGECPRGTGRANGRTRHARQGGPFAMSPTSIFSPLSTPRSRSSSSRFWFIPRAFVPLAWACLLLVAVAGVHERVREYGSHVPRPRTSLHVTRIAYASWNRMGP